MFMFKFMLAQVECLNISCGS